MVSVTAASGSAGTDVLDTVNSVTSVELPSNRSRIVFVTIVVATNWGLPCFERWPDPIWPKSLTHEMRPSSTPLNLAIHNIHSICIVRNIYNVLQQHLNTFRNLLYGHPCCPITEWCCLSVCPSVRFGPISPEWKITKTSNLEKIFLRALAVVRRSRKFSPHRRLPSRGHGTAEI